MRTPPVGWDAPAGAATEDETKNESLVRAAEFYDRVTSRGGAVIE